MKPAQPCSKQMTIVSAVSVVTVALGSLLALPATSQAGDHKIFPGSLCRQSNTDSIALEYNYSVFAGALQMEAPGGTGGAGGADVSCPIVRDNEANTTGFKFYAWVNDFWGSTDPELDKVTCS